MKISRSHSTCGLGQKRLTYSNPKTGQVQTRPKSRVGSSSLAVIGGGELYDVFSLDNVSIDNFKLKNVRSPALMQESGAKISISHGRPDSQGNGSVNAQWGVGWGELHNEQSEKGIMGCDK